MKAQDYVDQYLPKIHGATEEEELKDIYSTAFVSFLDDTVSLVKSRNAVGDDAIISIINEEGDKWHKFCRVINEEQKIVKFDESMFIDYWKDRLDL